MLTKKDPFNEHKYVNDNIFLPDINNEKSRKNSTYKENLVSLNKFSMTLFTEDSMVQPIESEVAVLPSLLTLVVVWIL